MTYIQSKKYDLSRIRIPKVWQYWYPKIIGIDYSISYLPKFDRQDLLKKIQFMVTMDYKTKARLLFLVPRGLYCGSFKHKSAVITTNNRARRYLLKPYATTVVSQIIGLTFRYRLMLRVKGLGYKAYIANAGKTLNLKLGYSHIVAFNFAKDMFATKLGVKDRMFAVEGSEWVTLTNVVARIQSLRKIDFYRGKGIFKKFYSCKIRISRKKKK